MTTVRVMSVKERSLPSGLDLVLYVERLMAKTKESS